MGGSRKNRRAHALAQPRTFFAALAVILALTALAGVAGCASRQAAPPLAPRPAPPIDSAVPERLETATFALG